MKFRNTLGALALLVVSATASANLVTDGSSPLASATPISTGFSSFVGYWTTGTTAGGESYLSQTISTVTGQMYDIMFDTGSIPGSLSASLDGTALIPNPGGTSGTTVVAENDNSVLTFIGDNLSGVSNVVVNAVPEPGSLALFGIGLAGLGILRRRKDGAA